jgi:hypothetical protein
MKNAPPGWMAVPPGPTFGRVEPKLEPGFLSRGRVFSLSKRHAGSRALGFDVESMVGWA